MLQRSDPFKQRRCVNADCLLCRTNGKGSCWRSTGVTDELVCQACKSKYVGKTSRSAYTRGREHFHALARREQSSVMWRHCCDRHERNEVSFVMGVTGFFRDDAMLRQITESVLINKVEEGKLINSKSESGNRPFAGSGHMVQNKLHWDANDAVGLPQQRNSYQSSPTSLCFESPTASFASQCNLFRTMWPDPAKGLLIWT